MNNQDDQYAKELAPERVSAEKAGVGHVVGEGGRCWCGKTHQSYSLARLFPEDVRLLRILLQDHLNTVSEICTFYTSAGRSLTYLDSLRDLELRLIAVENL